MLFVRKFKHFAAADREGCEHRDAAAWGQIQSRSVSQRSKDSGLFAGVAHWRQAWTKGMDHDDRRSLNESRERLIRGRLLAE
jgi:hypothetical protein